MNYPTPFGQWADEYIESNALCLDAILPGLGFGAVLRDCWFSLADMAVASLPCDCPMDPYHRWNCTLTPIWAQTIRDLDTNPWTVLERSL